MRRTRFAKSTAVPITAGATSETVALYRHLIDMGKRTHFRFGVSDLHVGMDATPTFYENSAIYMANGGQAPAVTGWEYSDTEWSNRWGAVGTESIRQRIIAAHAAGAIITMNHHSGNPVTGYLSRDTQTHPAPTSQSGTGYYKDKTGSPVTAILPGGSKRTQWLAYLDRLAAFLASLIDTDGNKIPVILRLHHECNGLFFWWAAEGAAKYKNLWADHVTYLRDTAGVTNVLYAPNFNAGGELVSDWFPGSEYTDVVTLDIYRDSANPHLLSGTDVAWWFSQCESVAGEKPLAIAEIGSSTNQENADWYLEVLAGMTTRLRRAAYAATWRSPWGPDFADSTASKAAFTALLNDPRAIKI